MQVVTNAGYGRIPITHNVVIGRLYRNCKTHNGVAAHWQVPVQSGQRRKVRENIAKIRILRIWYVVQRNYGERKQYQSMS